MYWAGLSMDPYLIAPMSRNVPVAERTLNCLLDAYIYASTRANREPKAHLV